jgi:YHS domain-containing protein
MKNMQLINLNDLGFSDAVNYCDPLTVSAIRIFTAGKMTGNVDPVCKMEVDAGNAQYSSVYEGVKYVFCSARCQQEFEKNPGQYIP